MIAPTNHRALALQLAVQLAGYGNWADVQARYDAAMVLASRFEVYLVGGDDTPDPPAAAPAQAAAA